MIGNVIDTYQRSKSDVGFIETRFVLANQLQRLRRELHDTWSNAKGCDQRPSHTRFPRLLSIMSKTYSH